MLLPEPTVILRDTRLHGIRPSSYFYIEVAPWMPLMVAWVGVAEKARFVKALFNKKVRLDILCHGTPGNLQLCVEGVSVANAHTASALKGLVGGIILRACSVANDGGLLCRQLANAAECPVFASKHDQRYHYNYFRGIDFGDWEGDFCGFMPTGHSFCMKGQ